MKLNVLNEMDREEFRALLDLVHRVSKMNTREIGRNRFNAAQRFVNNCSILRGYKDWNDAYMNFLP